VLPVTGEGAPVKRPPLPLLKLTLRLERCLLYYSMRLFRLKDSAERVARGFALGVILNFIPTFGAGVFLSGLIARLLGGHLVAGFVGGASLAFAWPVLTWLNFYVGAWLLGRLIQRDMELFTEERLLAEFWRDSFLVGCAVNILVFGLFFYGLLYWLFRVYRAHGLARFYHLMKKHQREVAQVRAGIVEEAKSRHRTSGGTLP
jgi:uncharacterized protein